MKIEIEESALKELQDLAMDICLLAQSSFNSETFFKKSKRILALTNLYLPIDIAVSEGNNPDGIERPKFTCAGCGTEIEENGYEVYCGRCVL